MHFGSGRDSLEDADGSGDDDDDDYYDYKIENDAVGGMIGGASMKNLFGGLKEDLVAVLGASTLLASDSDADAQKTLRQEVVELRRDIEDGRLRGVEIENCDLRDRSLIVLCRNEKLLAATDAGILLAPSRGMLSLFFLLQCLPEYPEDASSEGHLPQRCRYHSCAHGQILPRGLLQPRRQSACRGAA